MLEKILGLFQKPTDTDENGNILQHENYRVVEPLEHKEKFFKLPISRNVIQQNIVNKYDFIAFINEYKNDATKIFYNEHQIKAVFNYSTVDIADHGDSYCQMDLRPTRDFAEFKKHIETNLSQKDFIRILKRMEPYIIAFDGKTVDDMDIIEIAENLQATKSINSVMRNTAQAFLLDTEVKAGNSSLTIPRFITFEIPVYQNDLKLESEFKVELFLQGGEGGFTANLVCYKLEQSLDEAVRELTQQVQNGCDGIESFMV